MIRDFDRLQLSAVFGNVADGMSMLVFPLLAASVTSSPLAVGAISAARTMPWLLASLHVGVMIERRGPRRMLVAAHTLRAPAFLVLAAVALLPARPFLVLLGLVAFCVGSLEVVSDNSAQTLIPEVVPTERLPAANARMQTIENVGLSFAGPPVASVLAGLQILVPLPLISAGYLAAAAVLRPVAGGRRRDRESEDTERLSLLAGWHHIRRSRALLTLALSTGLLNLASAGAASILVLDVGQRLHERAWAYGVLLSTMAGGTVVAALIVPRLLARAGEGLVLRSVLVAFPAPMCLLAFATSFWQAAVALAVIGALEIAWSIVTVSFRQEVVPADLLARVNVVYRMLAWGSIPIGAFLTGAVAQAVGIFAAYLSLAALLCVGWPVASAIRPQLFERERKQLIALQQGAA